MPQFQHERVRLLLTLCPCPRLVHPTTPAQVTLAVVVCSCAHVLHAVHKPWGVGSASYIVQHVSLFTTTFVFLMGLLFKVKGVSQTSGVYVLGAAAVCVWTGVVRCVCAGGMLCVRAWGLLCVCEQAGCGVDGVVCVWEVKCL